MIRDYNLDPAARVAETPFVVPVPTTISLTGVVIYSFLPGYRYRIKRIRSFCRVKAGTVTAVVKIGTRTAASIVFTQATEVAQTLSTTLANLKAAADEAITVELTTDGSGALTHGTITIITRPYPLNGEAAAGRNSPG
jgi:hypothetical protein